MGGEVRQQVRRWIVLMLVKPHMSDGNKLGSFLPQSHIWNTVELPSQSAEMCFFLCVWFELRCVFLHSCSQITERFPPIAASKLTTKASEHAYHTYMYANTCTHWIAHNSLRCPEPVWPSAGMWSEAGNVWAMKACVYAGCSRPSPARGKTDISTASFALHLTPSPPNPQRDLFSPLALQDFFCRTIFLFIPLLFPLIVCPHQGKLQPFPVYKTRWSQKHPSLMH